MALFLNGDRICPHCDRMSLLEDGLTTWKCSNPACGEVYTEEELDADVEMEEE